MRVFSRTRILLMLTFLCISSLSLAAGPPDRVLVPRRPANKGAAKLPPGTIVDSVVLKFQEGTHVRLRGKSLAAPARDARESAKLARLGLTPAQVENDLHAVQALLASSKTVRGLDRLFTIAEGDLAAWRASGEARSGQELADLDLYYRVQVPAGTTQAEIDQLVDLLNTIPSIEIAYTQAPPSIAGDISPTTANYQPQQGYLNAAPNGINALYAWTVAGGRGTGTKIVDVEGAWRTTHEDLPPMFHTGGTQDTTLLWRNHGTAVMGVMVAGNNGYGVTGIAHGAQIGYEAGLQATANAISNAAMAAGVSGLVLIEIEQQGPATPSTGCGCATYCDVVPMEWTQANYDAIASATANGRIVVEAGANGASNLDDPVYGGAFNRMVRDSGAILVAAGESYQRSPTCFTNFGSRIDMHAWGRNVVTLGYGDLFNPGGDENQWYTSQFSGTSSASPIVTGAAASVIGASLAEGQGYGYRTPAEIRKILRDTGTPQVSDYRNIGPMPNLAQAIPRILDRRPAAGFTINCQSTDCIFNGFVSYDPQGIVSYQWDLGDGTTATGQAVDHTYADSSSYLVTLTVTDTIGQTGSESQWVDLSGAPPTGPNNYSATATSPTSVSLNWTSSAGGVGMTTYVIQRRTSLYGAWGPEIRTTGLSYVDTQVSYGVMYEYRIKALDEAGQSSDWWSDFATTVVFGRDLLQGETVLPEHVRDLRDAVDAWRTYAGLAQVYPANPLPAAPITYAHFATDYSVQPLPGVVNALDDALYAMGWPAILFGGVPMPGPGVPVYVEWVNQLREVLR
jgi:serine protease